MNIARIMCRVAAACTLLAASGAAFAVDCSDGIIQDENVREIIINGQSCLIVDVDVRGSIIAENSAVIVIVDSHVDDRIIVRNSIFVTVKDNRVQKGGIRIVDNDQVVVIDNNTETDLKVNRNTSATVARNESDDDIVCHSRNSCYTESPTRFSQASRIRCTLQAPVVNPTQLDAADCSLNLEHAAIGTERIVNPSETRCVLAFVNRLPRLSVVFDTPDP